ncbi:VRR-NUC domain-containing protein [Ketobacter sp.]|uniref:VRR-NUC domain-containing protein n=1 Tax=Ketobacter sp. TaxID=2083498 RepID=UPI000F2A7008|nr:VRR-NUC domain-containing protein [Ketobacter sp.]RLU00214.1 MAG: VRR-NUC domain-containing protein [Ketobacter sp.]
MSAPEKPPELPIGYHVENLTTLLHGVMAQYADLLTADEHALVQQFDTLNHSAKSLFYRLLTRQGTLLRQDKLNYGDVPDLEATLLELEQAGLCRRNPPAAVPELLHLLTRPELICSFSPTGHSKLKKPELVQRILEQQPEEDLRRHIQTRFPYVEARYQEAFTTFLVCFFGNSHQDLTEFVISELGHVRYESYSLCRDTRYFQTREQIEHQILYAQTRQQLEDKTCLQDADRLLALAQGLPAPDQHPHLQRRYQSTLIPIARQLERLQQWQPALGLFRLCDRHPSLERQARILKKLGQLEASLALCQQIRQHSQHPEALEFVDRFLPQLHKALGQPSPPRPTPTWPETHLNLTRPADTLTSETPGEAVEWLAAAALSDQHHQCCYVENTLFNGLFGLLFWDIVFAAVPGAFINPFQRGPLDLHSEDFYPRRQPQIEARLQQLTTQQWQDTMRQHFAAKAGIANPFVFWEALSPELLERALQRIPPHHLHAVFRRMLQHPGLYRNGFPDLIRFAVDHQTHPSYELIEIKGPGDKLQANQIRWLNAFVEAGIPASVCWVHWEPT